jgi:hypothetical protein
MISITNDHSVQPVKFIDQQEPVIVQLVIIVWRY